FTLLGRFSAGLADLIVVLLIFKTVELLEKNQANKTTWFGPAVKYWASLFYATAVLPIQLAHFFATDPFLNLLAFASIYAALRFFYQSQKTWLLGSGVFLGMALASKISAIFILPINLLLLSGQQQLPNWTKLKKQFSHYLFTSLKNWLIFIIITYVSLRLADPYLFAHANLLDPRLNPDFIANLKTLKSWEGPDVMFPPAIQWISKGPWFGLKNLSLYGLGLIHTLLAAAGLITLGKIIKNHYRQYWHLALLYLSVLAVFIYQSLQFVKALRYFLLLYPFLAILGGIALNQLIIKLQKTLPQKYYSTMIIGILLMLLTWPLMFNSIYVRPHSRVSASHWLYRNLPTNSLILTEHWDDGLPLSVLPTYHKTFRFKQLPVFDPDTPEKFAKFTQLLDQADYYILTSNRGWGSIPTVPDKYPQMTRFYADLFAGKLGYQKIAEFTSYPSLQYLGIPITINDDQADETFTVYDHPKVMVFKNETKN
ncbi:MAG: hypothetical protein GF390_00750, partial [Candidatus Pacebacteria bacterium]|nr:hypothetical protein [Candidatus Paceibacterota bacterium]